MFRTASALALCASLLPASFLARLEISPAERSAIVAKGLPVYQDLGASLLLPLSGEQVRSMRYEGFQVEILDSDFAPGEYFIVHKVGMGLDWSLGNPSAEAGAAGRVLWQDDRIRLARLPEPDARALKEAGIPITQLRLIPRPLPSNIGPGSVASSFAADSTIAQLASCVSPDSLSRTIQDLENFGTRYSYSVKCESAAFYLRTRLADLGYSVRLDTYYLTSPTTRAFNVEATLQGSAAPESILVACGHFDSYNASNQNDAPGADDNATGTAAVLELARVLRQTGFRRSVKFLCFSGEEQWMKGSYHWVDSTAVPESLLIAGAYNLDMFGYAAYDTDLVFINTNTASRPLANLCDSTNSWYGIGLQVMNYLDEDIYGDNTPFWEAGYLSVFALEDSEYGIWGGSNPHYHTSHDTFGNLTMSLVARTTRMVAACLATLAMPCESTAVAERIPPAANPGRQPTLVREVLFVDGGRGSNRDAGLLDIAGRSVLRLTPGANNVRALAPGIYFVNDGDLRRVVKVR